MVSYPVFNFQTSNLYWSSFEVPTPEDVNLAEDTPLGTTITNTSTTNSPGVPEPAAVSPAAVDGAQCSDNPSEWLGQNSNVSPNKSVNVNICLWNARSIVNKLPNFESFLLVSDFQIRAITESWLSTAVLDNETIPPQFCIDRKNRVECREGGVFLVVH